MINFATLKGLTIPEGIVKAISKGSVILWQLAKERLPKEYQELKYLEGRSGYSTYIDLGFAFDTSAEIYLTQIAKRTGSDYVGYQFGASENSGTIRCMLSSPYAGLAVFYGSNGSTYEIAQVNFNENGYLNEFKIIIKKGYREIINLTTGQSSTVGTTQSEYTMTSNLYLFGQNYNGSPRVGNERIICAFKYYDKNGKLICDLVPCYRKSDCKPGMYDIVRKTFLTNVGSNVEFAIGPHVNFDGINQVPISINADGSIYNNGLGYKDDSRVRSGGAEAENVDFSTCTGYIPLKKGETLEIFPAFTGGNTNNAINFFDANFNCLGQATDDNTNYGICLEKNIYQTTKINGKSVLTLTNNHDSRIAYVRITNNIHYDSLISTGEAMIVTVTQTNYADPTSADWLKDARLGSDGTIRYDDTALGHDLTNFIGPLMAGDIIDIYGLDLSGTTGAYRSAPYKADKTGHGSYGISQLANFASGSTPCISNLTITPEHTQFTNTKSDVVYWRFGGKVTGNIEDVVITINEPIIEPIIEETITPHIAPRSSWYDQLVSGILNLASSNTEAALGVSTPSSYAYIDRNNKTFYLMPIDSKYCKATLNYSATDGLAVRYYLQVIKDNGDTFSSVKTVGKGTNNVITWDKGTADYLLISIEHTDGATKWDWNSAGKTITVTFSNQ